MARTKTTTKTALTGLVDLNMRLDFSDPDDPDDVIPDDLKAQMPIRFDDGSAGTSVKRKVSDALTPSEATTYLQLSNKIRNHLYDQSGIPDV